MKRLIVIVGVLLLLGLSVAESGCTFVVSGSAMDGRVVDEASGKPIPGALVIAQWSGDVGGPVQSSEVCFHLEIATTDADGRYRIPGWSRRPVADWEGGFFGLRNIEVSRRTYKDGYVQLRYDPRDKSIILMTPFSGTAAERIDYLALQGTPGCGKQDGSRGHEIKLWQAICSEAIRIPGAGLNLPRFHNASFLDDINQRVKEIEEDLSRAMAITSSAPLAQCTH